MKVNFHAGDKVLHVPTNKTYEFGYYTSINSNAVVYEKQEQIVCDIRQLRWLGRATGCAKCGSRIRNKKGRLFHINIECIK